jgi:excisionase family DNA binding protein
MRLSYSLRKMAMEKTAADRLVYSIPEAAHALHCSRSLVYDLVEADKLPHVHLSEKRVVIQVAALERYLREQSEGGNE